MADDEKLDAAFFHRLIKDVPDAVAVQSASKLWAKGYYSLSQLRGVAKDTLVDTVDLLDGIAQALINSVTIPSAAATLPAGQYFSCSRSGAAPRCAITAVFHSLSRSVSRSLFSLPLSLPFYVFVCLCLFVACISFTLSPFSLCMCCGHSPQDPSCTASSCQAVGT